MSSKPNRPLTFGIYKSVERLRQLVNNKFLSDVTFKVGSQLIYAHKNIITMASEVFFIQFTGSFAELAGSKKPIVIEDIEPKIFLMLMEYIYCDQIVLTAQNVLGIYYTSQKYMMQELIDRCETFFGTAIDEWNALTLLNQNHLHKFPAIDKKCLAVIQDNPLKFFKLQPFLKVHPRTVELIASSRKMNCYKEHLEKAIEAWLEANDFDKECDIVPKLEGVLWRRLDSFSAFDYSSSIDTELVLTVTKPFKLYGLGVHIGALDPITEGSVTLKIDVTGKNVVSVTDQVQLKSDLYVHEVLFEKVTMINQGEIKIAVTPSSAENRLFRFNAFVPVKQLAGLTVQNKTIANNYDYNRCCYRRVLTNCIAYLLYNFE